ncbi:MAG: CpsB/CapC family capsule biosynthesis tyrosine phosphatase [Planctomycetaceae bacterium]
MDIQLFRQNQGRFMDTLPPAPEPFHDIHCHLVPGIDDGSPSWEVTLAMARMAVADGFQTIICTPHQLGNFSCNTGDMIRERVAAVQERLNQEGIPLRVRAGGDVRIEEDLIGKIRRREVLTLADAGKYVLLELPHEVYIPLDPLIQQLQSAGMIGILSHPERNAGIMANPRVTIPLVEQGCLMQVTAGSLTGRFGNPSREVSEWMLKEGLVHFLATDAHGLKSRRPTMRRAFHRAAEIVGHQGAVQLCCRNPQAVVDTRRVEDVIPAPPARSFWSLFGWSRAS